MLITKHLEILLFLSSAFAFLAPRSENPANYIVPGGSRLVPDEFVVKLRDGHTLEDHFENIGLNISKVAQMFSPMELINSYRCRIDSNIMHDLIRHDPGVQHVEHNHSVDFDGAHGYSEPTEMEMLVAASSHSRREDLDGKSGSGPMAYGLWPSLLLAGRSIRPFRNTARSLIWDLLVHSSMSMCLIRVLEARMRVSSHPLLGKVMWSTSEA
jgi:hypothetical protein